MIDGSERASAADIALAHRYRRWCLTCLYLSGTPVGLEDVAHQLAVWDDHEQHPSQRERAVYTELRRDHLPPMRAVDLVDHHQGVDFVELGPAADGIEPLIGDWIEAEVDDLLAAESGAAPEFFPK